MVEFSIEFPKACSLMFHYNYLNNTQVNPAKIRTFVVGKKKKMFDFPVQKHVVKTALNVFCLALEQIP